MFGPEFADGGALKFGALLWGITCGRSSGTPNEIMSTILDTSFAIFSGRLAGKSFPTSFRLQRYIARANSGNRSWPDLVVSDRVLALISPLQLVRFGSYTIFSSDRFLVV